MNNQKPDSAKFSVSQKVRLTEYQNKILKTKALEQNTTVSEILRTAVTNYIDRNMTDTEILYATLTEQSRKIRYLENKVEVSAILLTQMFKYFIKALPVNSVNSSEFVETKFENFKKDCAQTVKEYHGGFLESFILDMYEKGVEE